MPSNFLRNPRTQVLAILIMLTFSGSYLWWFSRHEVRMEELAGLEKRKAMVENENRRATQAMTNLGVDKIRQAIRAYGRQEAALSQLLPVDSSAGQMLSIVYSLEQENDVKVLKLEPMPREIGEKYVTDRYKVIIRGRYHDVGAFLASLGSLTRITHPTQLSGKVVDPRDAPADAQDVRLIEVEFVLEAYSGLPAGAVTTVQAAQALADSAKEQGKIAGVRYERDSAGKYWQYVSITGRPDPIKMPVPASELPKAQAALGQAQAPAQDDDLGGIE